MNREERRAAKRQEKLANQQQAAASAPVGSSGPTEMGPRKRTPPGQFLKETRQELRKVAWPTRSEVISYTIVVLVVTAALTTLVWGLDWVIARAIINVFE